jgi:hypothetical protein
MFVPKTIELDPIDDADLHWLAGLLEGEGTFIAGPPSAPRSPAVQVAMVDRDIVERAGSCSMARSPSLRLGARAGGPPTACGSAGGARSFG